MKAPDYDALACSDGVQYNDFGSDAVMTLDFLDEAGADFIKFEFFNIRFEAPEASVSGRDTNTMTVELRWTLRRQLGCNESDCARHKSIIHSTMLEVISCTKI